MKNQYTQRQVRIEHMLDQLSNSPIFILGISPRSGTNYLQQLLRLHSKIAPVPGLHEDSVLFEAHLLSEYVELTARRWRAEWGLDKSGVRQLLMRSLGVGIANFFHNLEGANSNTNLRLLAKTPLVDNLDLFPQLFPHCQVLIVIRDGRDVVESTVRSFGWSYEQSTRLWRDGARTIVEFDRAQRDRLSNYCIVRYEDLVTNLDERMAHILKFLNLDSATYDFEAMHHLPVYGSSAAHDEAQSWRWGKVSKPLDFKPVGRWQGWGCYRRQRFNWTAGHWMRSLGYQCDIDLGGVRRWAVAHWFFDHCENIRIELPEMVRRWRGVAGRILHRRPRYHESTNPHSRLRSAPP